MRRRNEQGNCAAIILGFVILVIIYSFWAGSQLDGPGCWDTESCIKQGR